MPKESADGILRRLNEVARKVKRGTASGSRKPKLDGFEDSGLAQNLAIASGTMKSRLRAPKKEAPSQSEPGVKDFGSDEVLLEEWKINDEDDVDNMQYGQEEEEADVDLEEWHSLQQRLRNAIRKKNAR